MAQVLSAESASDVGFPSVSSAASSPIPSVPAACLGCRSKHLKCDGATPCLRCTSSQVECIYIASRRGWKGPRRRSYAPYILPQLTERTHNPLGTPDSHEPKPRLGKDEVEQLELEFSKTPKPNSYVKKELSERMGVEVSRINNWFQNRRAKEKQMRETSTFEALWGPSDSGGASKVIAVSESPDTSSAGIRTNSHDQEMVTPDADGKSLSNAAWHYQKPLDPGRHHETSRNLGNQNYSWLQSPPESCIFSVPAQRSFGIQEAVSYLMDHFYSLMGQWYFRRSRWQSLGGIIQAVQNTGDGGTRNYVHTSSGAQGGLTKRTAGAAGNTSSTLPELPPSGNGDEDDEERDNDERKYKKPRVKDREAIESSERLACPYFKHNPGTYRHWRSCPGPGWGTVHRVKEHLYRCHLLPPSCPRCHETFDTEKTKLEHLVSPEPCSVIRRGWNTTQPVVEGVDPATHELLRSRKLLQGQDTEATKWRAVYLALFPDTEEGDVPSPYYEYHDITTQNHNHDQPPISSAISAEFAAYEHFLQAELPSHIRQKLTTRVEAAAATAEDIATPDKQRLVVSVLKTEVIDMVKEAQLELFRLYRSRSTCAPTAEKHKPPTPESTTASIPEEPGVPLASIPLPGGLNTTFIENSNISGVMYDKSDDDNNEEITYSDGGLNSLTSPTMDFGFGPGFDGVVFDLSGVLGMGTTSSSGGDAVFAITSLDTN